VKGALTRQVKGALKVMPIKTDRRDALGIAQLIRMGWFRPVHCKSVSAQELRALLGARRTLQKSMISIALSMRGMLRGFGLKLGQPRRQRLPERARKLADGNEMLTAMVALMLRGHAGLRSELARLENRLRRIARADRVVRLMMTVPGAGAVVALQLKAGIDDPARFRSSKNVGPHFGLKPPARAIRRARRGGCDQQSRRPKRVHRPVPGRDGDALPVAGEELARGLGHAGRQETRVIRVRPGGRVGGDPETARQRPRMAAKRHRVDLAPEPVLRLERGLTPFPFGHSGFGPGDVGGGVARERGVLAGIKPASGWR
jgi:hypothetical protein